MRRWGYFCAILLVCSFVYGQTLTVPGDYATIQEAIDAAFDGYTVVVAPGVYSENLDMGGKAIMLTSTDPNDPAVIATTIIDGGGTDTVIDCSGVAANGVIAGFRIQNGNGGSSNAGGIWCQNSYLTIKNCILSENVAGYFGAGIYCYLGAPFISNCMFLGNDGGNTFSYGGGLGCYQSDVTVDNCVFSGNDAVRGGAIAFYDCVSSTITNCTFSNNTTKDKTTGGFGGAVYTYDSDVTVVNSILWEDFATQGGNDEIYIDSGTVTVSYSLVQGSGGSDGWNSSYGTDGGNNVDDDPQFADPDGIDNTFGTDDDDLHIDPNSVCVNAGDLSVVYPGQVDMDLMPRIRYSLVDIGADEAFFIDSDLNFDGKVDIADLGLLIDSDVWLVEVDLTDFARFSQDWLLGVGEAIEGDLDSNGCVNMTDLMLFVNSEGWLVVYDLEDFAGLASNWLVCDN